MRVWDLSDYGVLTNISAPSPATCCYFTLEDEIIVGCTDGANLARVAAEALQGASTAIQLLMGL